jgi:hypothetical protein
MGNGNMNISLKEKMNEIEDMARAALPMVGYTNFMIKRGSVVDVDEVGKQYLKILKRYNCCGEGNRPHYLKLDVPGGSNTMIFRVFFDGISGAQFFANRFYGVLTLDFRSFEGNVDVEALECLREYLTVNRENLRFILYNVPPKSMNEIISWDGFNMWVPELSGKNAHEYVLDFYRAQNKEAPMDLIFSIEKILERFPIASWEDVMRYLEEKNENMIDIIGIKNAPDDSFKDYHIGF